MPFRIPTRICISQDIGGTTRHTSWPFHLIRLHHLSSTLYSQIFHASKIGHDAMSDFSFVGAMAFDDLKVATAP